MQALDRLDADRALVLGFVRQHWWPGHIANCKDARHIGSANLVDGDHAAINLHAEFFQAEIFSVTEDPDGGNDALGLEGRGLALAVFQRAGDFVSALFDFRHFRAGENLDALLLEALAGERGDLGILDRQDLRQQFDDGHLASHRAIKRGEFDADRARAHDDERLRKLWQHHRFKIGPDQLAVGLDAGQHARPRAGRDDDVLCLIRAFAERALRRGMLRLHRLLLCLADADLAGFGDRRFAPDHVDLVLLHQETDAAIELAGNGARAFHDSRRIVRELAFEFQAVILGVFGVMVDFRRAQKRLCRNAAPVQADAAEMLALHHRRLETELRGADRRDIAARPAADDEDVVWTSH